MEDLDALMPFTKTEDVRQQSEKVLQQIERLKKLTACIHELEASQNNRLQELEHALETDDVARALSAVEESQYQVVMAKESKKISDMIDGVSSSVRKEEEVLREIEEVVESLAAFGARTLFSRKRKRCAIHLSAVALPTLNFTVTSVIL
ncbi:ALIX V-shaped domain binding to HIV [Trypanosoma brucei equiperdum]|uniref:ALIX V-shaped domain binding to HIV n=1 Tax=Trypanosoma brucei equiperdum TaxID=630700 RepID=A0A3L6KWS5_9TRYP|nr:ALIX V-shaped domain binding to HIV [Trypanosoma brucei equiperdum]